MPARPFLKWAGGKGQLLPDLVSRMPPDFQRYHEPFVGGGALFFHLWNSGRLREGATLSDFNPELIRCYRVIKHSVEELIEALGAHAPHFHERDYFYEVRSWDRQPDFTQRSDIAKVARMLFLNRTCYNGLYRLNNKGHFNAPFGNYKKPLIVDGPNLRAVSAALQEVELHEGDFRGVLDRAAPGDFVYFDPPYVPVSPTASFTQYTRQGFDEGAQRRLADVVAELDAQGCRVMLSNSATDFTHTLYARAASLRTAMVKASRKINCDGTKRGFVDELIVYNYEPATPAPETAALSARG